jgi:hypothetical protein
VATNEAVAVLISTRKTLASPPGPSEANTTSPGPTQLAVSAGVGANRAPCPGPPGTRGHGMSSRAKGNTSPDSREGHHCRGRRRAWMSPWQDPRGSRPGRGPRRRVTLRPREWSLPCRASRDRHWEARYTTDPLQCRSRPCSGRLP